MKKLLSIIFLAACAVAFAQVAPAPAIVQGPVYFWRAQVAQIAWTSTLTVPAMTSFPVEGFSASDVGTVDANGVQTVITSAKGDKVAFDMLDSAHAAKVVTWTAGGVTYSMPYSALVAGFSQAVLQEAAGH